MRFILLLSTALLGAAPAVAQTCGGNFSAFVDELKAEAVARGHSAQSADEFFASVRQDPEVLKADRRQGVFQMPFTDFARRLISNNRLNTGQAKARQYDDIFNQIDRTYGIDRGVLLAFWAFETDYGSFQGDFNTLNALV